LIADYGENTTKLSGTEYCEWYWNNLTGDNEKNTIKLNTAMVLEFCYIHKALSYAVRQSLCSNA
jgi:hypothetical protein